ncbi:hypothetical protein NUF92_003980 [Yersinia enterocolitica]|nr:hypothetical protein [Yersinia enterocolitica]HDL6956622.1 hypothetical protein [Yersinia enterocolitica]HDL6983981.1 hypothetical protein [Yersinia enterocolitica]HDL6985392.1 hypothetical protein [Yersinia enterocolitica]HDL7063860.1 hypothetical protein [Yersinia enterocolitica]
MDFCYLVRSLADFLDLYVLYWTFVSPDYLPFGGCGGGAGLRLVGGGGLRLNFSSLDCDGGVGVLLLILTPYFSFLDGGGGGGGGDGLLKVGGGFLLSPIAFLV